jgi:hypothetical protein|tara:strand:+ start:466 stop:663 length:198 start_codon:yes stop_codon:yes gene_type:complete
LHITLTAKNGITVKDIANEVVEQLDGFIDDTIYQHDIYDEEHKELKRQVLRVIIENIEDYYDEKQ